MSFPINPWFHNENHSNADLPRLNNRNVPPLVLELPQEQANVAEVNEAVDFVDLLQNYQRALREFRAQINPGGMFDNILAALAGNNEEDRDEREENPQEQQGPYELAEPIDPDGRLALNVVISPEPTNLPQTTQTPPPSASEGNNDGRRAFGLFPPASRTPTQAAPVRTRTRSNSI